MDAEMLLKLMSVMKSGQNAGASRESGNGNAGNTAAGGFPLGALLAGMNAGNSGQQNGGNALLSVLPFLLSGMNGGNAQAAGAQQNGGGGTGNMLPLLLSLMSGGNPFGNANAFKAAGKDGNDVPPRDNAQNDFRDYGGCRDSDAERGDRRQSENADSRFHGNPYARNAYATRAPYRAPFDEIGFAGAEVRGFMEKLWRLRRRV